MEVRIMVKLEITKIDGYIYQLLDQNKNKHSLNLEFIGIKEDIKVGDFINISDELLNQEYSGYSTNYTFGELKSKYGKNISGKS